MSNATELSTLSPVEHDLLFLERMQRREDARHKVARTGYTLARHYGKDIYVECTDSYGRASKMYVTVDYRTNPLPTTIREADQLTGYKAEALFNEGVAPASKYRTLADVADDAGAFTEARLAYEDADIAVEQCKDEYARRPWRRYWLVTSSDGHIHASTECSTCNKGHAPTGFALVPYLSGASAKDAVADLGSALCSVCFPDAPVEDREQVKISARVALVLAEEGVEAFQQARAKAQADAKKRASERCEGSGQPTTPSPRWGHKCTVCGYHQTASGKSRAHRRPRWYAVQEVNYNRKYWNGSTWAPSTKKVDLLTEEQALAIVSAHGGTMVLSE
jgi:hypothetical protein